MSYSSNRIRIMDMLRADIRRGVEAAAIVISDTISTTLKRHASNIDNGGIPSQPGEPPGTDTGTLARSWGIGNADNVARAAETDSDIRHGVGSKTVYAAIHEFGGFATKWSYLPARPYIRPSIELSLDRMKRAIAAQITGATP